MATGGGKAEKILVSVRVRPRNDKEKNRNDICDWECVNDTTIICNQNLPERSLFPSAYTFDRVFGFDCPTKNVYEDGAKEVALSVLAGINSSIFAYGQTSSGKTYTMSGITHFAIDDIFDYVDKQKDREFTLKFSALEIYNEAVRDLLSGENTQLRLLDDPERGTVVEKLIEETLQDRSHLEELLSVCEAQRRIGETSLNETSSRSHQILRLTIESRGRDYSPENSSTLAASVCFVDLAGSERASQTLSAGTRLKEGCHINRSLLTLGTVIRKLSKGKNGHVPYRDSKLTRILQNSLGGNARTAIICTMSPARSHVEQSRNTLLFASCAKEVTTNAQVNMVVSEKALVRQLQQELARMENELKNLGSDPAGSEFYSLLKQKEEVIAKMEEQIKELKWQRDVAQSRVENLLKSTADERSSRMDDRSLLSSMDLDADSRRRSYDSSDLGEPILTSNLSKRNFDFLENCEEDDFLLDDSTPQFSGQNMYDDWEKMAQKATQEPEDACKEVRCIEMEGQQIRGQAATVESQDSIHNIVDKKAVSEVLSPKEETLSAPEYKQNYNSFVGNERVENGDMEISTLTGKKNVDLSLKATDVELSPYAKPEIYKQTLENSDIKLPVDVQETEQTLNDKQINSPAQSSLRKVILSTNEAEQCSKKDNRELSLFTAQSKQQSKEDPELNAGKLDEDALSAEALKEKVKEMQKTIEYLMSMQAAESPSFRRDHKSPEYFSFKRSRSCRDVLLGSRSPQWFDNLETSKHMPPVAFTRDLSGRTTESGWRVMELKASPGVPKSRTCNTSSTSFDSESTISSVSITTRSVKDFDPEMCSSFNEFVAGIQEMARQHHSSDSTPELDYGISYALTGTETIEISPESPADNIRGNTNALPNPQHRNEETTVATNEQPEREHAENLAEGVPKQTDSTEHKDDTCMEKLQVANGQYLSSDFERQQMQIIELWGVCNVPLVHRTYFFLLFKGDPSDFVYMEVELRRLSFLKQTMSNDSETSRIQTVKALTREKEWLSKQIPKKFPKSQKLELYQKWGIELNSKQRSLQVAHNLWTNTRDMEHIKESASLVAKLLGFVEPCRMQKEMFGLSLSPKTVNTKSSGWRFTKSFSAVRLTG